MTQSNEQIKFISYHQPSLTDGDYELRVKQQVQIDQKEFGWGKNKWDNAPEAQLRFSVAGPRFKIDPGLIQAQFPPPKSIGEYYNVLPQIVFKRTTLPWERTIDYSTPSNTDSPKSWMALLLFDANDPLPKMTTLTLEKLISMYNKTDKPEGCPEFVKILPRNSRDTPEDGEPVLKLEVGQHPNDRLTVIDVPKQLLWQLLPSEKEIGYLAHIREGISATDSSKTAEYPLIFCNRLPAPGTLGNKNESEVGSQSVVHLVSLESRKPLLDELSSKPSDNNLVRLVSLARWSFSTLQRNKTFSGWLKQAWGPDSDDKQTDTNDAAGSSDRTADPIHTLRMPRSSNADAEGFLSQGYVPIQHQTRQGNHLVSWYRGPLLPGERKSTDSTIRFPVRSSDKFVRYFSDVGMFDTTYAAAWELGRMLTLRSKRVSVSLFNWKRKHAQNLLESTEKISHLPFAPDNGIMPEFPELVEEWFNDLMILKHIPFHYLVPTEEMLPVNSLRFFNVDAYWLESLLDGAFSVGRVSSADADRDVSIRDSSGHIPDAPVCSGFLLRSPVVSGWPHLGVEAYTQTLTRDQDSENPEKAKRLRMDRLGKNVFMCLFEGDIQTVDIHEHRETVHFGVDTGDDPNKLDNYSKKLRGTDNKKNKTVKGNSLLKECSKRVINIAELAKCAKASNSAEFGVAMIEGVEKVRFIKK